MYKTTNAVAMVVFNRPDCVKKVLEQVRRVQPERLYVIADGPRADHPDDMEKVQAVRALFDTIDWDCEVHRAFSETNMGVQMRPSSGFEWVFSQEPAAIFLEDDCVPCEDFFRFCDDMLERYRDDSRVMLVSGTNVLGKWKREPYSYHFSRLGGIHGWASWRRAWAHFDLKIQLWNDPAVRILLKNELSKIVYYSRASVYNKLLSQPQKKNTWAYQWGFARLVNSGLALVPCENLITNVGFGVPEATNTISASSPVANLMTGRLSFPLSHPPFVIIDTEYDERFIETNLGINPDSGKLIKALMRIKLRLRCCIFYATGR